MRLLRPGLPLALGLAALVGRPAPAPAATLVPPSLAALAARADRIIVSEVVEIRCERDQGRGDAVPVTLVTVRVARTLKGAGSSHVVLEFLGGRVDEDSLEVFDVPRFGVGDRDVLFLAGESRRVSPLVGVMHGRFRLLDAGDASGERVAAFDGRPLTHADLARDAGPTRQAASASAPGRPVSLAAFEKAILELVARPADPGRPATTTAGLDARGHQPDQGLPAPGRLHVDVDLGPSPALLDGCADWACALESKSWFRHLAAGSDEGSPETGAPAERVSLEWGQYVFGRVLDTDTLALAVRRTTGDGSRTAVVFNERLAWTAYGDAPAVSAAADGPLDLPAVAVRELSLVAAAVASTAPGAVASGSPARTSARSTSNGVPPSRAAAITQPLEAGAAACGPGDVFVDPRLLVFDSPDHAMLTAYQVGFFQPGAASPTQVVDMPLTAFLIRRVVDLPAWAVLAMQSSLVADIRSAGLATPIGVVYTYRVRGVWAGGTTAWSDSSQPFVRCATTAAASR